jgi:hypothetical protein
VKCGVGHGGLPREGAVSWMLGLQWLGGEKSPCVQRPGGMWPCLAHGAEVETQE